MLAGDGGGACDVRGRAAGYGAGRWGSFVRPAFAVFIALFVIGGLTMAASGPASADEPPVVIGAMYNLTGGQRDLDVPSSQGARLAVDLANAGAGVLGRAVELILLDGRTEPTVITEEARKLFRDRPEVAGLIGFSDTDMVLAGARVAAEHERVFVTSGATSPLLPDEVPGWLFLACFGDNVQAAAGAEWAFDTLKARTVAVLYKESSAYARLLHGYFETRFKQLGGQVVVVVPYSLDDISAKPKALPEADLIYLAAQPDDVASAVPAIRAAGIDAPILGGDGMDIGAEAWAKVSDASDVYFTTHAYLGADNPDPTVQAFRAAFAKAYPEAEPDAFTALGYDAARLFMAAIERAGSTEPQAVRDAVAATKNFSGVTGTISFKAGSQIPDKSVTVMGVEAGRERFEASVTPSDVPAP
jgi:branched-chain amino acid transport system substrate-binding protein